MPDVILATLNAKYIHASFGLRYLLANLGELRERTGLCEFEINQRPLEIVESLLRETPQIIGFGVYIWNVAQTTEVVAILRRLAPGVLIVLGGPEVSFETEGQAITALADHVITGEADLAFPVLCRSLLTGERNQPKIINAPLPDFAQLKLPYDEYDSKDIAHRILYVEASRGCPFTCEFCLSSLDIPVRQAVLGDLLPHFERLIARGARHLKFVDRTFNLNVASSRGILLFLLERWKPGMFFHFEMVPDRLPDALREVIQKFPPGSLQFEVGVQTFNPEVGSLIQRRQDYSRLRDNFEFLRRSANVHIHADLIVGLPGESAESFAAGFDALVALGPHEIQVGILKRLRGTPIVRHDAAWEMLYNPHPPYELLQNRLLSFNVMQELRRFARYWDLVGNSGNFVQTAPWIWAGQTSAFSAFSRWSAWLYHQTGRTDSIALPRLMELLFRYLTQELGHEPSSIALALWKDYQRGGRKDKPSFLRGYLPAASPVVETGSKTGLKRQARYQN